MLPANEADQGPDESVAPPPFSYHRALIKWHAIGNNTWLLKTARQATKPQLSNVFAHPRIPKECNRIQI